MCSLLYIRCVTEHQHVIASLKSPHFEACYLLWSRFNRGRALWPSSRPFRVHYEEIRSVRTGVRWAHVVLGLADCGALFSWCIWNNLGEQTNPCLRAHVFVRAEGFQVHITISSFFILCSSYSPEQRRFRVFLPQLATAAMLVKDRHSRTGSHFGPSCGPLLCSGTNLCGKWCLTH